MYRKITLFAAFIALIVIVYGSYVRLTAAEQGCPDWPLCYGQAFIVNDAGFQSYAASEFSEHTINIINAWKKLAYRYLDGLLGVLILSLAAFAWTQKSNRLACVSSTLALLMSFSAHIFMELGVIEMKSMPVMLLGYDLLTILIFAQLYWFYLRLNPALDLTRKAGFNSLRLFSAFAMLVLLLQIVSGLWVSINNAGLACTGFPKCNDSWFPNVDYLSALNVFAGLESGYKGILSFDGQVAVNVAHRISALVGFIVLTLLMLSATSEYQSKPLRKAGLLLSLLVLIETLLGVFSLKLELPLWIVVVHNVFAVLLMIPLVAISFYSKYSLIDELETEAEKDLQVEGKAAVTVESTVVVEEPAYVEPTAESLYLRLKTQLSKTRKGLGGVLLGQKSIDEDLLEQIESSLLMADIGIDATTQIIDRLTERLEHHQLNDAEALEAALKEILLEMLQPCCQPLKIPEQDTPFVILVVGINGVGKTTTIGKLAKRLQLQGNSVMLAAGDTFRAAAVEQLETWGERNNIHVVAQHTGADSASVIFDAVESAKAKNVDVLIADTAGRLHTKSNLMEELSKIKRIMSKVDDKAPHEVMLVLDAGTGQNALSQTKIFNEAVRLSGLTVTKLDGTAKGGVMFALAKQFGLPIRFIGVGEGIDDLQDFDAKSFIDALFTKD